MNLKEDVGDDIEWVNGVPYDTSRFNEKTEREMKSSEESKYSE